MSKNLQLLPLDKPNKLFLQFTLSPGLLKIFQTAEVKDNVASLAKVDL